MSNNSVPGNREGSHSSPSDQNEAEMSRLTSRFGLNLVALSIFEKKLAQTFFTFRCNVETRRPSAFVNETKTKSFL